MSAEAGIQSFQRHLDSRLRGSDGVLEFFPNLPVCYFCKKVQHSGKRLP